MHVSPGNFPSQSLVLTSLPRYGTEQLPGTGVEVVVLVVVTALVVTVVMVVVLTVLTVLVAKAFIVVLGRA
jgi:hypothetical protein